MRIRSALAIVALGLGAGCGAGRSGSPAAGGSGGGGAAAGGAGAGESPGTLVEPGDPGAAQVAFDVRTDQQMRPISPLVYGLNTTEEFASTRPAAVRAGGNRYTAYNWENNASNAGADYQYQNDGYLVEGAASPDAAGEAVRSLLETVQASGATALLTVPIVDYVAADKNGGGDVRNSGADYLATRFRHNLASKGLALSLTPDRNDDSVYQDEFVNWVRARAAGPVLFLLDNEPDSWASTHPEVHPSPVTYAELVERNTRFAAAVKDAWPEASVLGFVSYGWSGYVTLQDAPDAAANGDFIEYYLRQMAAAEVARGRRLVDYLDLHWYPEARGGADGDANGGVRITDADSSDAVVQARLQAPRSLWDATYVENSWITRWSTQGPIDLLPRVRKKIDARYPGTRLAISEWNYGGGTHISGGIASADVLGIFGREGVDLACNFDWGGGQPYARAALRVFRNFDGHGGTFGDTSVHATTSDVVASSVYASLDSTDPGRVVIVAINKLSTEQTAGIRLAAAREFTGADVFTLTAAGPQVIPAAPIAAVATNAFRYPMPPYSVSVLVPRQ